MEKYPYDEWTTVVLAPAVYDVAAPSLVEIAAGTDITCFLTKDGFDPGVTNNNVDSAGLCTRYDAQVPGSVAVSPTLKGFRDKETDGDEFWDMCIWGEPVTVIVRRGVLYGTPFAAGDKVEVYQGAYGQKAPEGSATNTAQMFTVPVPTELAELDAVVDAT